MNPCILVLLAEDDEYDAQLFRSAINMSSSEDAILVVQDGKDTLDYLYREGCFATMPLSQPAVVVLDLKMPRIDGFEVLERAKSDPVLRVIPFVVLTSSREPRDLIRAYELGANAYVVKAMDFTTYTESVRMLKRFWLEVNEAPLACSKSMSDEASAAKRE